MRRNTEAPPAQRSAGLFPANREQPSMSTSVSTTSYYPWPQFKRSHQILGFHPPRKPMCQSMRQLLECQAKISALLYQHILSSKHLVDDFRQLVRLQSLQTVEVPVGLFRQPYSFRLLLSHCYVLSVVVSTRSVHSRAIQTIIGFNGKMLTVAKKSPAQNVPGNRLSIVNNRTT